MHWQLTHATRQKALHWHYADQARVEGYVSERINRAVYGCSLGVHQFGPPTIMCALSGHKGQTSWSTSPSRMGQFRYVFFSERGCMSVACRLRAVGLHAELGGLS